MSVRMRFQLRRRDRGAIGPASALFVPGRDTAALWAVCTRLGLDPSGRVHDLAGGFLLKLDPPTAGPVPGTIRLRELGGDLFVPVDADLVPALLDDEAAGMVRDGGLVFLPGGAVLRFDRTNPLGMEALVVAAPRARRDWQSLPAPRRLAERIVEIARERPEAPPEQLYQEWEQDVRRSGSSRRGSRPPGTDDTDGGGVDEAATTVGGESGAAGSVMSGLHGFGEAVRGMMGRAGAGARSLGEHIGWGMLDQSALVQKLLREFREGDYSRALRHAFPMTPPDPRDRTVGAGGQLPWNRAIYNLFDLLGGSTRGRPVGVWQARQDLLSELGHEYRKSAERSIQQGDYRRAAYIYGKLLGDHRTAAQALQRGGLHHDAAILYLKKVNDRAAAAQAFEAAGQVDRAIEIHRELGAHEAAGDLLRRLGDEEGAVNEYVRAVQRAIESAPADWYAAGCLLLHKARLSAPAMLAFRRGWDRRPEANAAACALELAWNHAVRGTIEPIRGLLDEADDYFMTVGSLRDAESFYTRMAVLAAAPALAPFAEEVHDRAVQALAHHLRRQVECGYPPVAAVSGLFGEPALWTPAFLRDARFAALAAASARDRPATEGRRPRSRGVQVGRGMVAAACQAAVTAEVFLGFADGKVLAFRPERDQVVPIADLHGPVAAIAADPDGQVVVVLRRTELGAIVTTFVRRPDGSFRAQPDAYLPAFTQSWLTPIHRDGAEILVGVGDGQDRTLIVLDAISGLPRVRVPLPQADESPAMTLLLPERDAFRVLTHEGSIWRLLDAEVGPIGKPKALWRPAGGGRHPRCAVPLGVLSHEGAVMVIGLDEHGAVYSTAVFYEQGVFELLVSRVATTAGGYLAAAPVGPDQVVAVSERRIDWLICGSDRFQLIRTFEDSGLANTVACFRSPAAFDALVVSLDGFVAHIDAPRRVSIGRTVR